MADRSNAGLAYKIQTALGTPAVAPFKLVPESQFSPGYRKNRIEDPTILGTRFGPISRGGTEVVAPVVTVPFRSNAYDEWMASLFMGAWTANLLIQANTRTYFTLEDRQSDAGAGYAGLYQDVIPNSMTLRVPLNGLVEVVFNCLGTQFSDSATLSASPTAAVTDTPYDSLHGTFNFAGSTYKMLSLELTMDNRGDQRYCLGSSLPDHIVFNPDRVSGRISALFDGVARLDDVRNATSRALAFTLVNGAKSSAFSLPAVVLTTWDSPVGTDPERTQTFEFEADVSGGTKVSVTRVP